MNLKRTASRTLLFRMRLLKRVKRLFWLAFGGLLAYIFLVTLFKTRHQIQFRLGWLEDYENLDDALVSELQLQKLAELYLRVEKDPLRLARVNGHDTLDQPSYSNNDWEPSSTEKTLHHDEAPVYSREDSDSLDSSDGFDHSRQGKEKQTTEDGEQWNAGENSNVVKPIEYNKDAYVIRKEHLVTKDDLSESRRYSEQLIKNSIAGEQLQSRDSAKSSPSWTDVIIEDNQQASDPTAHDKINGIQRVDAFPFGDGGKLWKFAPIKFASKDGQQRNADEMELYRKIYSKKSKLQKNVKPSKNVIMWEIKGSQGNVSENFKDGEIDPGKIIINKEKLLIEMSKNIKFPRKFRDELKEATNDKLRKFPSGIKNNNTVNNHGDKMKESKNSNNNSSVNINDPSGSGESGKKNNVASPYNYALSDHLPLDRAIPDTRNPNCLLQDNQASSIPPRVTVSVVIAHRNERRATLLRTIASILRNTPARLLSGIVLVDDASDEPFTRELEMRLPSVTQLRNEEQKGVAVSRLKGVKYTSGSHVVFLDSHCEVNKGWLEPLLHTVMQNPYALASPTLDVIDTQTLEYKPSTSLFRGGFGWGLLFRWLRLEKGVSDNTTVPYSSPVLAGGLFLVARRWWDTLGGYDPGLTGWGADNIEISLKSWLCGGSVIVVPCSRVGHLFAKSGRKQNGDYLRNSKRIAEVWMGPFKEFFYDLRPRALYKQHGNMTSQVARRESLRCRDFSWFLMTVYPDLMPPRRIVARTGALKQGGKCLLPHKDTHPEASKVSQLELVYTNCINGKHFEMTIDGLLVIDNWCITASPPGDVIVHLERCGSDRNMRWRYSLDDRRLLHVASSHCVDSASIGAALLLPCTPDSPSQDWTFE